MVKCVFEITFELSGRQMNVATRSPSLVLLLSAICLMIAASGCFGSGGSKIAYISTLGGDPEVALLDSEAGEMAPLTSNVGEESDPRWSPDRKYVAFVSGNTGDLEINLADRKGETVTRLTHSEGDDMAPRWSPDGSRLAFISNRDSQPEIYLMGADGSNPTRVTTNHTHEGMGDWSPDGLWLVFYSLGGESEQGLWLRNPDGVNLVRLTDGEDTAPSWSPDGRHIAFVRGHDEEADIFVVTRHKGGNWYDQPEISRLTHDQEDDLSPVWSPNGKSIAFVSHRNGGAEIYTMQTDGSEQRRLTSNEADDYSPVWSQDSSRIAWVSNVYGTGEIFVMDADGTNQLRLTNNTAEDHSPRW